MIDQYFKDRDERMKSFRGDPEVKKGVSAFMDTVHRTNYVKNWSWMGVPILQLPTDMFAIQELIWTIKPNVIIETGTAFGGSALFYASVADSLSEGRVVSIDNNLRPENKEIIEEHPVQYGQDGYKWLITLMAGDSTSIKTVLDIELYRDDRTLIVLDSNHTHEHVLQELKLYSPLVSVGSYIIVMDTSIEWLDPKYIGDRPWGKGNSPYSAVQEFMKGNDEFVVDTDIEDRILLTSAVGGWLKRVR